MWEVCLWDMTTGMTGVVLMEQWLCVSGDTLATEDMEGTWAELAAHTRWSHGVLITLGHAQNWFPVSAVNFLGMNLSNLCDFTLCIQHATSVDSMAPHPKRKKEEGGGLVILK